MAITTYAELKTAMADWSHRSDLTAKMGDFITLAESRFNDALRLKAQDATEALTGVVGSNSIAFPSGMKKLKSLTLVSGSSYIPLEPISQAQMDAMYDGDSGQPLYYTVADTIELDVKCDTAYTINARVFKEFGLSDASPTNDLLTEYPNVYLNAAMVELWRYVQDDQEQMAWEARLKESVALVNRNASRSRSKAKIHTDLPTPGHFDIIRGDY